MCATYSVAQVPVLAEHAEGRRLYHNNTRLEPRRIRAFRKPRGARQPDSSPVGDLFFFFFFILSPFIFVVSDLPRAEERRRVSDQHQGVPQGLHVVSRRGKRALFSQRNAFTFHNTNISFYYYFFLKDVYFGNIFPNTAPNKKQ